MASAAPISEHEAALYDRQIRLWGLDAQQRFGLIMAHCIAHLHTSLQAALYERSHYWSEGS